LHKWYREENRYVVERTAKANLLRAAAQDSLQVEGAIPHLALPIKHSEERDVEGIRACDPVRCDTVGAR